jgi:hypothetical protein
MEPCDANRPADPRPPASPESAPYLLLQAFGGGGDQLAGVRVEQQNRDRVRLECLPKTFQRLVQQIRDVEPGQRRGGDCLELRSRS